MKTTFDIANPDEMVATNRRAELRNWTLAELRYELRHQQAPVISTWGNGICGHQARGCGFCEKCIAAEVRRREGGDG